MRPETSVSITKANMRVYWTVLTMEHQGARLTVRSIASEMGVGSSGVFSHLSRLRTAGLIDWEEGLSGTMRVILTPVAAELEQTSTNLEEVDLG